ncbi:hypothetical protein AX17_003125 [Amanita inopinata Kibby_2008]|nr:hypothetical protein AX17_003125 [Amanita inopinata Kibby_2008]
MTGPHIFSSNNAYQQTPYTNYYHTPQISPFLPPLEVNNYPPSPYRGSSPLPGSSNTDLSPNTVQFPGSYEPFTTPQWQLPYRPRAPSYHGPPAQPPMSPFIPPSPLQWPRQQKLSNPMYPNIVPSVVYPASPWSPAISTYAELPPTFSVHPYLNGEVSRGDIIFNLAAQYFSPSRLVAHNQAMPFVEGDLVQAATHPPVYRLRIVCNEIPEWPIVLEYDPENYREQTGAMLSYPPPITVGDVLSAIHRTLHERISHVDWAKLDHKRQYKISQAYTARCTNAPTMEQLLKNDGVKKVDYLLDKVWFRGLVRTGEGPEVLRLVVSRH